MTRYQPQRADGRATWEALLSIVEPLNPGDLITYDDITDKLGLSRGDMRWRSSVAKINKKLVTKFRRVECVRSAGYRMLRANEHGRVAIRHQERSTRQLVQGVETVRATDYTELTEVEKNRTRRLDMVMTGMLITLSEQQQRLDSHDRAIRDIQKRMGIVPMADIVIEVDDDLSDTG